MHEGQQDKLNILTTLRKKRDGEELSRKEIEHFVQGHTRGEISDHQAAAWLMAAHVRGLSRADTTHLTHAILHSAPTLLLLFQAINGCVGIGRQYPDPSAGARSAVRASYDVSNSDSVAVGYEWRAPRGVHTVRYGLSQSGLRSARTAGVEGEPERTCAIG